MVLYKCERCNKTFNRKSNFTFYINRQVPCKKEESVPKENTEENDADIESEENETTDVDEIDIKTMFKTLMKENKELKKGIMNLKREVQETKRRNEDLEKRTDKLESTVIRNTSIIVNGNNNIINSNITIIPYEFDNIFDRIDEYDFDKALKDDNPVFHLVENIHFNSDKYPQFRNMRIPSDKRSKKNYISVLSKEIKLKQ